MAPCEDPGFIQSPRPDAPDRPVRPAVCSRQQHGARREQSGTPTLRPAPCQDERRLASRPALKCLDRADADRSNGCALSFQDLAQRHGERAADRIILKTRKRNRQSAVVLLNLPSDRGNGFQYLVEHVRMHGDALTPPVAMGKVEKSTRTSARTHIRR